VTTSKISCIEKIGSILEPFHIEYDFFFCDYQTRQTISLGEKKKYPFASCYKLAILGSCLDNLDEIGGLDRVVTVENKHLTALASGVLQSLKLPVTLSIENLLRLMMAYSDGAATDILMHMVGFPRVKEYISKYTESSLLTHNITSLISTLVDRSKNESGSNTPRRSDYLRSIERFTSKEDYTSAKDLTLLLEKLMKSGELHRQFLMRDQGVPRSSTYCPSDVQIFGKTGTLGYWAAVNDCGIICKSGSAMASFGITTMGWNAPRYIIENCFGEIGRIITSIYSEDPYSGSFGS
jgi:beta-lactamase class A